MIKIITYLYLIFFFFISSIKINMIKLSGHSNGISLTPFSSTRDISTLIEKHEGM